MERYKAMMLIENFVSFIVILFIMTYTFVGIRYNITFLLDDLPPRKRKEYVWKIIYSFCIVIMGIFYLFFSRRYFLFLSYANYYVFFIPCLFLLAFLLKKIEKIEDNKED